MCRKSLVFNFSPVVVVALAMTVLSQSTPAVVLDAARGHEDGCDRPASPPHSETTRSARGPVVMARYFGATTAYGHGVLGDAVEAEGLMVRYEYGDRVVCDSVLAGAQRVFEDTSPRLVDIDGDGVNEVIAVASHQRFGARLELYGYPSPAEDFRLLASTPYIGQRFRWLAPAGAADFDGDGVLDIAYVETPHLGKRLKIVSVKGDELVTLVEAGGFSNHRIGDRVIWGGIRDCGDGPEIVLGDAQWSSIVAVQMRDAQVASRKLTDLSSFDTFSAVMDCQY